MLSFRGVRTNSTTTEIILELKKAMNKQGWAGWAGGEIYNTPKNCPQTMLDDLLKLKSKETHTGAVVISANGDLRGWGYTDERYLNGPYFWPIAIDGYHTARGITKDAE